MLIDLLFPKHCYVCSKSGSYLCEDCFIRQVDIQYYQKCHVCSKPSRIGFVHEDCREDTFLDGIIHITYYQDPIKNIILEGKYKGYSEIFKEFGEISSQFISNFYNLENFLVTSVPLHKSKKSSRGFNQSEVLAKEICKILDLEYMELLKRNRKTKTQVGMTEVERRGNLNGAFECIVQTLPKKVLLIDDVVTTGTTLEECSKILKSLGVKEVLAFAIAKSGDRMV